MPTVEVLFHVGDSSPEDHHQAENWEDGQIIEIRPPALWWTRAELLNWMNNDVEPPGFDTMTLTRQEDWEWKRIILRRFLMPNFSRLYHINQKFEGAPGIPINQTQLDNALAAQDPNENQLKILKADKQCAAQEVGYQAIVDDIILYNGIDTSWGYTELTGHSVVQINATVAQLDKVSDVWRDETYNVFQNYHIAARTRWKIDYQAFMTPQQIADVQDPTVLVIVDRSGPGVPAGIATVPVVRDLVNNPEGPGNGVDP